MSGFSDVLTQDNSKGLVPFVDRFDDPRDDHIELGRRLASARAIDQAGMTRRLPALSSAAG
jgi:hypothetical protein